MKKLLAILFSFILMASLNINAQFSAGPIGGINFSDFRLEGETENELMWGVGAVLEYRLTDNFALQTEPMYMLKGAGIKPNDDTPHLNAELSFVEIPLLLKYELGDADRIYFLAGPVFSFLLTSDLEAVVNRVSLEADLKPLTEKFEMGITGGAGIAIPLSFGKILLEGRYNYGFTNLAKTGTFIAKAGHIEVEGQIDSEESSYKTIGIQFFAGLMFEL